jgi:16S rRNA processing protein RimM
VSDINDIDAIKEFTNSKIYIDKQDLPKLDNNEAYWFELVDMKVIDKDSGDFLGKVSSLNNFGAQDCLEINPTKLSVDDERRLIPFIRDKFIQSIEREKNIIYVNWDKTF